MKTPFICPSRSSTASAWALAGMAVLALAGCESTKLAEPVSSVPVETRSLAPNAGSGGAGASSGATPQSSVATVDLAARQGGAGAAGAGSAALLAAPSQRVVYFDFDSFVVKDDYRPVIDGYARLLAANRGKQLVVEGHTDDRGGSEYNLALGQKRAEAVVRSLTLLGATGSQIEAVSFGKERPATQGSDESAWAKNRRAELRDR